MSNQKLSILNNLLMGLAVMALVYGGFQMQQSIYSALAYWWDKVGVVMVGLLPLSFMLLGVVLYLLVTPQAHTSVNVDMLLKVISFAAPSLGLLGTVLGTVEGTAQFSLADGVKELLDGVSALMHGLSIALLSTAWGSIIGIPAGILHIVLFEKKQPEPMDTELVKAAEASIEERQPDAASASEPYPPYSLSGDHHEQVDA